MSVIAANTDAPVSVKSQIGVNNLDSYRYNIPKTRFILWMLMHERLVTKKRLAKFTPIQNGNCELCEEEEETSQHLFFECKVTKLCLLEIQKWLGWRLKEVSYTKMVRWIQRARLHVDKKRSLAAVLSALVYWIWRCRNRRYWCKDSVNTEEIVNNVKNHIHCRFVALGVKMGYSQI